MSLFLRAATWFCASVFAFVFLVAPTRTGQELLSRSGLSIAKHELFLMFAALLGISLCAMAQGVIPVLSRLPNKVPAAPQRTQQSWLLTSVLLLLGSAILLQAAAHLFDTFDWDEIERISFMAEGNLWFVLNPLTTLNHPIATLTAHLSSLVFGMGKFGLRFPSLLFSGALVGVLALWAPKRFRGFTLILVLAHLAVNSLSVWYFQSMRGYVTMLLATLTLLLVTMDQIENPQPKKLLGLLLVTALTLLTHGFGGVFAVSLLVSLVVWMYLNRNSAPLSEIHAAYRIVLAVGIFFVLIGAVFLSHIQVLDKDGWLSASHLTVAYKLSRLTMVLGANQVWVLKSALLLTVLLALLRAQEQKLKRDFLSVFVLTSISFVGLLFVSLRVDILEGRMVLGFLVPWLLWVGESVSCLETTRTRVALGSAAIAVLLFPQARNGRDLLSGDLEHFQGHEKFAELVVERLQDTSHECVSYSGEPRAVRYFQTYYLRELPKFGNCVVEYHLYFAEDQFGNKFTPAERVATMDKIAEQKFRFLFSAPAGNYIALR